MSVSEKRLQIYLPKSLFATLKKEAQAERKSIAQIVREAIESHLKEIESFEVHDASSHHDSYLNKGVGKFDIGQAPKKRVYHDLDEWLEKYKWTKEEADDFNKIILEERRLDAKLFWDRHK